MPDLIFHPLFLRAALQNMIEVQAYIVMQVYSKVRIYTLKMSLTWLPKHDLDKKDTNGYANVEGVKSCQEASTFCLRTTGN